MRVVVALRLVILTAAIEPKASVLVTGRRTTVGRARDVDILIPDPSVSPHHATIMKRGEHYLLVDESSAHGTLVAGPEGGEPVCLAPDSPRVIKDGERIWFGQIEVAATLEAARRGEPSGQEELPLLLVRAGLVAAGLAATDEMVEKTLQELTELPEQRLNVSAPEQEIARSVGVADLRQDDESPPWITDTVVAGLALLLLSGCAYGIYSVFY